MDWKEVVLLESIALVFTLLFPVLCYEQKEKTKYICVPSRIVIPEVLIVWHDDVMAPSGCQRMEQIKKIVTLFEIFTMCYRHSRIAVVKYISAVDNPILVSDFMCPKDQVFRKFLLSLQHIHSKRLHNYREVPIPVHILHGVTANSFYNIQLSWGNSSDLPCEGDEDMRNRWISFKTIVRVVVMVTHSGCDVCSPSLQPFFNVSLCFDELENGNTTMKPFKLQNFRYILLGPFTQLSTCEKTLTALDFSGIIVDFPLTNTSFPGTLEISSSVLSSILTLTYANTYISRSSSTPSTVLIIISIITMLIVLLWMGWDQHKNCKAMKKMNETPHTIPSK